MVTVWIGDPTSNLHEKAEAMPAPSVAVVEVDSSPVDEVALRRSVGCDLPQRVDEYPCSHVRSMGAVCGTPDVDAERGADDVIIDDV